MLKIEIYTDGSCLSNPGTGGYAAILKYNGKIKEISGNESNTTNNRMELTAAIEGLKTLKEPCEVTLYSDSQYMVNSIEKGWVFGWEKNSWKKSDKSPALNPDLWAKLLEQIRIHKVKFVWVRGHNGHPENERCDTLAVTKAEELKNLQLTIENHTHLVYNTNKVIEMKRIYLDNAATTKMDDSVLNEMLPFLKENFGNPSSIYFEGREAKNAVENARKQVAELINADVSEVFFTSGGTEADNWAIKGVCHKLFKKGKKHIITTAFEHHAVLHTVEELEKDGFEITVIPVDNMGLIKASDVEKAIREDTAIVSIMYANNEIGTILPIREIGEICRNKKVMFHTDGVQAVGKIPVDVKADFIDLMSISAHKFNGPKGVGALYVRKGTLLDGIIHGGAQEKRKRSGTENVASIVGFGSAAVLAKQRLEKEGDQTSKLRDYLIDFVMKNIPHTILNGDRYKRLPCNANFSFAGIEGESLLLHLDMKGISASSGSACTSGSLDPSHVLMSLGLKHEIAHGSLRLTLSHETTKEEIDFVCSILPQIIDRLRQMSPLWEKIIKE